MENENKKKKTHVVVNKKTETSGSSRTNLKLLQPGQFVHAELSAGAGAQTYKCLARDAKKGRNGVTTLTLMTADGKFRKVLVGQVGTWSRRASIAEMKAFRAAELAQASAEVEASSETAAESAPAATVAESMPAMETPMQDAATASPSAPVAECLTDEQLAALLGIEAPPAQ